MKKINRRDFLKWSATGTAAALAAGKVPGLGMRPAQAAVTHTFEFTISDAIKEMHTHVQRNVATCYFWLYRFDSYNGQAPSNRVDVPGPSIYVTAGDNVNFTITNRLDEAHNLAIPALGLFGASIAPNASATYTWTVPNSPGAYLYYDTLNAPVNRVMGLHGAFVVMPSGAFQDPSGTMLWSRYPYGTEVMGPNVKGLFDILGVEGANQPFPGLAWHEGEGADGKNFGTNFPTTPFRRHIWLEHQASATLFEQVGRNANISFTATLPNGTTQNFSGRARDPRTFVAAFTSDRFIATSNDGRANTPKLDRFNFKPQFFLINGQSGHFAHNNATIVPNHRVGEPCIISVLNAGLMAISHHLHANHYYLLARGSLNSPVAAGDFGDNSSDNPIWIDVYQVHPMTRQDWLVPYMKMPDIPNKRGLGTADGTAGDQPLFATANPGSPGFPGGARHLVYPPTQEFTMHHPPLGTIRKNFLGTGNVDIAQRQSPLCYPAHDHSEPTQTSQGGNYNTGLIGGMYVIGDRNLNLTFPIDEDFAMMLDLAVGTIGQTAPAAGPNP